MRKYRVTITRELTFILDIEAASLDEARKIAGKATLPEEADGSHEEVTDIELLTREELSL